MLPYYGWSIPYKQPKTITPSTLRLSFCMDEVSSDMLNKFFMKYNIVEVYKV
jgi:hypothetical protein